MAARSIVVALFALTAGFLVACDDRPAPPVAPEPPSELAVEGPPGSLGDVHNDALDAVLAELQAAADTLGPLSENEALDIGRPAVEGFLTDEGFPVGPLDWYLSLSSVESGENVVADYSVGGLLYSPWLPPPVSADGFALASDLVDLIADGPMPSDTLDLELQDLADNAQVMLSGDELEGYLAVLSVARSSADYWGEMAPAWNAVLEDGGTMSVVMNATAAAGCGWKTLLGDVVGATSGFLRTANWIGAGVFAASSSTAAYILCKADEQLD